jgi:hypothetical protein
MATPVVREWLANWSLEPDEQEEIGRNGIVTWNGVADFYHGFPIKVEKDEPVRVYITNMTE